MIEKKKKRNPELELMDLFDFDLTDLRANQHGYVSARQRESLRQRVVRTSNAMWIMVMFPLATTTVLVIAVGSYWDVLIPVLGFMLILSGVFALAEYRERTKLQADGQDQGVLAITGWLRVRQHMLPHRRRNMPTFTYFLDCDEESFQITGEAYKVLVNYTLGEGTVYYLPRSRAILSLELDNPPEPEHIEVLMDDLENDARNALLY